MGVGAEASETCEAIANRAKAGVKLGDKVKPVIPSKKAQAKAAAEAKAKAEAEAQAKAEAEAAAAAAAEAPAEA